MAMPVFYQMVALYPATGVAVFVPKGPDGAATSFMTEEACTMARNVRPHPEDVFCLRYESKKIVDP